MISRNSMYTYICSLSFSPSHLYIHMYCISLQKVTPVPALFQSPIFLYFQLQRGFGDPCIEFSKKFNDLLKGLFHKLERPINQSSGQLAAEQEIFSSFHQGKI